MSGQRRNRQLVRALALIRVLQSGRFTAEELAQKVGVTSRTVRRDIEALIDAGVPVARDGEEAAVWWIERDWSLA